MNLRKQQKDNLRIILKELSQLTDNELLEYYYNEQTGFHKSSEPIPETREITIKLKVKRDPKLVKQRFINNLKIKEF